MISALICPKCGAPVAPERRFCPSCGEPRSLVVEMARVEAKRTGVPFHTLLERARQEDADVALVRERFTVFTQQLNALSGSVAELQSRMAAVEQSGPRTSPARAAARGRRPRVMRRVGAAGTTLEPPPLMAAPGAVVESLVPLVDAPGFDHVPEAITEIARELAATPPRIEEAAETPVNAPIVTPPEVAVPPVQVWSEPRMPAPPLPPRRERSAADIEAFISGRGLAWLGGVAVLIGAIFFLSLAFSRGWIGPSARVVIGVVAAFGLILGGERFFHRKEATFGHVLVAVGLGIMSMSMLAATRLYDLIPVELGMAGTLLTAILAAAIAVRVNLQIVAGYGIVAGLAAPPLLGAPPAGTTIAFLAVSLVGATVIALYKTWIWLTPAAFLLTAPQFANWIDQDAPIAAGMVALAAFWLLHAVAAGGEEFRVRKARLVPSSATLLMANAAFALWGGFTLLNGDAERWRGLFLLGLALAHGALGGYFLRVDGDRHPFGMLAFGTGVAALTMAAPVQFHGAAVPMAWASEAAALAWVVSRLRNRYSAGAAVLLGSMAIFHLILVEYPFADWITPPVETGDRRALFNGDSLTLAYVLAAGFVAAYFLRSAIARRRLACLGGLLLIWAAPFETNGVALVASWTAVSLLAVFAARWPVLAHPPADLRKKDEETLGARFALAIPAILAYLLAVIHVMRDEYPLNRIAGEVARARPFLHLDGLAIALLLLGVIVPAVLAGRSTRRAGFANLAGGVLLYAMPFEFSGVSLIAGWAVVVCAAVLIDRRPELRTGLKAETFASIVLPFEWWLARAGLLLTAVIGWFFMLLHLVTIEYEFSLIGEDRGHGAPFLNRNGLALAMVLATMVVIGLGRFNRMLWANLVVMAMVYAMPFETSNVGLVAGWSALVVVAMVAQGWRPLAISPQTGHHWPSNSGLTGPALLASALSAIHFYAIELARDHGHGWPVPTTPFRDGPTLAALLIIAAAAVASLLTAFDPVRIGWRLGAVALAASLMPYEVHHAATVVAWSALAVAPFTFREATARGRGLNRLATGFLLLIGFGLALTRVASPDRLVVDAASRSDHPLLWSGATAAFGALAVALGVAAWQLRALRQHKWIAILSGAMVVYLLSVGIVDHFQARVGSGESLASLQKQAQVGLSILWAVLGVATFVSGVLRFGPPVRIAGLQLLGLATVKVFIWDLSTLDTSYRVLSFIGLGVLLLVSSLLYQHFIRASDDEHQNNRPDGGVSQEAGAAG